MKRFLLLLLVLMPFAFAHAATPTVAALQAKYKAAGAGGPPVKVLIVPGHEPDYGGAEYQGLLERDINVAIANDLAAQLKKDPRLSVVVSRDTTGWNADLTKYFGALDSWNAIVSFVAQKKAAFQSLGATPTVLQASHNAAPDEVAYRLYGITKWADENGVDLAIHIHLNDADDHTADTPGNQSGFAVYVPDSAFGNATTSRALGVAIADELNHYNATSSLAIENLGTPADQELIALGAYNTANYPSVLVEYAYIYEGKITNPSILPLAERDFANSTYRGVEKFFGRPVAYYDTLALPHRFTTSPAQDTTSPEIYSLQQALRRVHLYPQPGELYYDCPIGGYFGDCTTSALKAFQKSKGIEQTGTLGPKTRAALNAIWGGS